LKQVSKNKAGDNINDIDQNILKQLKIPAKDLSKEDIAIYQQQIHLMFFTLQKLNKCNYSYEAIGVNKNEYIKKIDRAISKYKEKKMSDKVVKLTAKKRKYIKKIDNRLMAINTASVKLQKEINQGGQQ
jgi:hypothetical protein